MKVFSCSLTNSFSSEGALIIVEFVCIQVPAEMCTCMHLAVCSCLHLCNFLRWGGWMYVNAFVRADCMWVCGLHHQLGQFLSLCLINGLPLAPLCRELRSVCSCSFRTGCTVYTQTIYSSDIHTYPNRCTDTCVGRQEENKQQTNSTSHMGLRAHSRKESEKNEDKGDLTVL